ncbi:MULTISPECIES: energy-coupling factor ABC transporter ATP-binding protein [Halolamina]|uniref:Biotin transport system ATP-binding protein n=1 Tax=Halolamina pelagica TaxID=699431 RepID=A0A1I5T096_9EURY|nr:MULTISPECIES: ABC transporter ATP-binding protein [Halolamina]NHX36946.1 ABC transporter ATP-binding protein [Halolamina sp. R1-12]SFP76450.1 biotin transport system ATP-binding protein [Halolamina pelagica]
MLELDGLTHEYDGARAVDGVSLTIPDGEFLVLCGPNGSGKSTLVRHLNGLLEPDAGEVLVDGTVASEDPVAARTTVGMAFQEPRDQFVAATVGGDVAFGPENLGLSHDEIDRRVEAAIEAVGLDGREDDRIETLSGGERERLAVAGALAMEPNHLVLDEPFTGLDSPARERLLARLRDLHADGTGLIVVTHDLRDVLHDADRVVCLADGEVVVDAGPEAATEELTEYGVRVPDR